MSPSLSNRALPGGIVLALIVFSAVLQPSLASGRRVMATKARKRVRMEGEPIHPKDVEILPGSLKLRGAKNFEDWPESGDKTRGVADDVSNSAASETDEADLETATAAEGSTLECEETSDGCGGTFSKARLLPSAQSWWGRISGAPTIAEYKFDEDMKSLCAGHHTPIPVARLPLSLPPNIYQQIFMSKETCLGEPFGEVADSLDKKAWAEVCKMVPEKMADVMPEKSRYRSCAVVGNSGNLLKSQYGKDIDGHDVVIRFNNAPTAGFETHVGSKVTYRVMNGHRFRVFAHDGHGGDGLKEIPIDKRVTIAVSHTVPKEMGPNMHKALLVAKLHEQDLNVTAASNHLHFYANHLLTAFKTCLEKRSHVGHVDKATSGIKAVLTALHLCDHVSVYGVGDSTLESKDIPYQYFTLDGTWSGRVEVSSHHNLSLEEDFLHALARGGIIRHCRYSGCRGDPVA